MKVCTCQNCGKQFEVEKLTGIKYCKECKEKIHKKQLKEWRFLKKQEEIKSRGVEGIDYIIDLWNGYVTTRITGKWFNTYHPDRTIDEYIKEFPDAPLICKVTSEKISKYQKERMNSPKWKQWASERMKGEKNINSKENTTLEQRQRISPFSKSFKNYDNMSDEEKEKEIRKNLQCDRDDKTSCQLNYWIKKGYSEDEARQFVSDRQRTFTLEKCIEKYGEEEGIRVYNERQVKWSRKIEKMYQNGEFSKAPKSPHNSSLYSQIEKEFINDLIIHGINEEDIQTYKTHQLELLNDNFDRCHNRRFMYDITYKNKIIEFNGDFWHMNPSIYDENYFNKISKIYAKDKWEIDKIKIECARKNGYDVLIVWEHDYRKDKENTIQKCLNFLLNKD